jgi:hypothetical protein
MIEHRLTIEDLPARRDHAEAVTHDAFEAAEIHPVGARPVEPVDEEAMQIDDLCACA